MQLDFLPELPPVEPIFDRPRLWIKRLAIWNSAGERIQNVPLRRGLNIVWSPDPAEAGEEGDGLGHGGGKTLFCRLLRFVLGEARPAPKAERHAISREFVEGRVGAEIELDGITWSVIRPLAGTSHLNFVQGEQLDDLAAMSIHSAKANPWIEMLEGALFPPGLRELMPKGANWLTTLAWLSRDQECGFSGPLDWRSGKSNSESPVAGFLVRDRIAAFRALIDARGVQEPLLTGQLNKAKRDLSRARVALSNQELAVAARRNALTRILPPDVSALPGPLGIEQFRASAPEPIAPSTRAADMELARYENDLKGAERLAWEAEGAVRLIAGRMPILQDTIAMHKAELPGVVAAAIRAEQRICPVCHVPIDELLAQGCGISLAKTNLVELRERHEATLRGIKESERALEQARRDHEVAAKRASEAQKQVATLEVAVHDRRLKAHSQQAGLLESWYAARKLRDEIDDLKRAEDTLDRARLGVARLAGEMQTLKERIVAIRQSAADNLNRLDQCFQGTVRSLIGRPGRVHLDGRGLRLETEAGGNYSAAAINSVKAICFDLAALLLAIEGRALLPTFLIHDSPRTNDMGLSIYHRLFRLIHRWEELGEQPLFQYIVTTTTSPPPELNKAPWVCLKLKGEPALERLLRVDLRM